MMLVKRNLLLFFRDRSAVFFSLLSVLIIIGLYALFLGDVMEQSLQTSLGFDSDKISVVIASITLAGMAAVTSVTSCLGALAVSVSDKENAGKDFRTSPVSRRKILTGYIASSSVVGFIMTVAALVMTVAYIISKGGSMPTFANCGLLLLTVVLSVLCGNAMVFFAVTFVRSQKAYTSMGTILGTLIGFIMGIYIPIGTLPETVQWVIRLFPMTHAASMFKQIFADGELVELFAAAPPEALQETREMFGVSLTFEGFEGGFWFSAVILIATTVVFYGASLLVMKLRRD